MGMYTEIYVNVDFKEDTPEEVIKVIQAVCNRGCDAEALKGFPVRWGHLFSDGSFYTPLTCCANMTFNKISNHWSLLGKGDIKNYEGEIKQFFKFIAPWCQQQFIGYSRHECDIHPTLVYSDDLRSENNAPRESVDERLIRGKGKWTRSS